MSMLRLTHLYQAHRIQEDHDHQNPSKGLLSASNTNITTKDASGSTAEQPAIAFEYQAPFGKVTVSPATFDYIGSSVGRLIMNASCQIDSVKEKMGLRTFSRNQAEELSNSGILDGDQWIIRPSQQLQIYHANQFALSGSLTFSLPGIDAYPLLCSSSAFRAVAALVAIGATMGPVENVINSIVHGTLDAIFDHPIDLGRNYHADRLRRALLATHVAYRTNKGQNPFEGFILDCLKDVPLAVREFCASSVDKVKKIGVNDSQLRSIAEWAFSSIPRTLVLSNAVEILATAVVSTFIRKCRIAIVNCHDETCQVFNGTDSSAHNFAIYYGGDGQKAIGILHKKNWLQPYLPPKSLKIPSTNQNMPLSCSVHASLQRCVSFFQMRGIGPEDTTLLLEAIKKDAITHFARKITIIAEAQEITYTKKDDALYYFDYGEPCQDYDWSAWLNFNVVDLNALIAGKPERNIQIGSSWYNGYTAQLLNSRESIRTRHREQLEQLRNRQPKPEDSPISSAISEVSGLIYALGLSGVHVYNKVNMDIVTCLHEGLRETYNAISPTASGGRRLARNVCLGILSQLWLDLPGIYIREWPHNALGISNSQGSVLSAIVGETRTLQEATTKFIISTDVPDLMQAELPVVACASTPGSTVQRRTYEKDIGPSRSKPYDGCIDVYCFTIATGDPPPLSRLINNRVIAVPVAGYAACGARWFEYVDLDDAFAVMAESFLQPVCAACDQNAEAQWLKADDILQREEKDGFSCCQPKKGKQIVVPAHDSGLKQSFLSAVFRDANPDVRYCYRACLRHAKGDVVIV
ncbi:hypothetical protein MMC10_005606 [Thelotrema lepadinum]|nr:hypothetical protein [Thelotrema lepadinum]